MCIRDRPAAVAYVPSCRSILTRATRRDDRLGEAKPAMLGRARCCVGMYETIRTLDRCIPTIGRPEHLGSKRLRRQCNLILPSNDRRCLIGLLRGHKVQPY